MSDPDHTPGIYEYDQATGRSELAMPFVVAGEGRAYEAKSYAAGWQMGRLHEALSSIDDILARTDPRPTFVRYIDDANVAQADLIAMSAGYRLVVRPAELPGFTYGAFIPTPTDPDTPGTQQGEV